MYNFEKFTKTSVKTDDRVSITKSYSFGFPRDFCSNYLKSKPVFVVLFYDKQKNAIGFQFTSSKAEKYKFKIAYSKQGYGASVAATSFFKANNIDPKIYQGKYKWSKVELDQIGDIFVIEINKNENGSAHESTPRISN